MSSVTLATKLIWSMHCCKVMTGQRVAHLGMIFLVCKVQARVKLGRRAALTHHRRRLPCLVHSLFQDHICLVQVLLLTCSTTCITSTQQPSTAACSRLHHRVHRIYPTHLARPTPLASR